MSLVYGQTVVTLRPRVIQSGEIIATGGYDKVRSGVLAVVRHDNLILAVLAVVIGLAVGWAIIGFRTLIDLVQSVFFGSGG